LRDRPDHLQTTWEKYRIRDLRLGIINFGSPLIGPTFSAFLHERSPIFLGREASGRIRQRALNELAMDGKQLPGRVKVALLKAGRMT
jgi:hypothetical protein